MPTSTCPCGDPKFEEDDNGCVVCDSCGQLADGSCLSSLVASDYQTDGVTFDKVVGATRNKAPPPGRGLRVRVSASTKRMIEYRGVMLEAEAALRLPAGTKESVLETFQALYSRDEEYGGLKKNGALYCLAGCCMLVVRERRMPVSIGTVAKFFKVDPSRLSMAHYQVRKTLHISNADRPAAEAFIDRACEGLLDDPEDQMTLLRDARAILEYARENVADEGRHSLPLVVAAACVAFECWKGGKCSTRTLEGMTRRMDVSHDLVKRRHSEIVDALTALAAKQMPWLGKVEATSKGGGNFWLCLREIVDCCKREHV
ncbi:hypothetical protein HK101_008437 [Irineochytrium annulatum]|nr:hypothetical protein HK101_008437 [Irineochytrium annulatum]